MNERLEIAIYIRVSTEDQVKEGYSLEVQRDYLNLPEEFISSYDPKQKELSLNQQKQVTRLLFKNIKIARKDIFF